MVLLVPVCEIKTVQKTIRTKYHSVEQENDASRSHLRPPEGAGEVRSGRFLIGRRRLQAGRDRRQSLPRLPPDGGGPTLLQPPGRTPCL